MSETSVFSDGSPVNPRKRGMVAGPSRSSDEEVRPNLFIIGAPRCATSSLHRFLAEHPSIFMSDLKEPGFFVPEIEAHPKDRDWYLGLFRDAGDAKFVGESSTHYAKIPTYTGVPDRIARFCHRPRFIYLMRDPVERAISHYWHCTRQNAEFRPPLQAIEENVEYRAFGDYALQLSAYMDRFGREPIFSATFERMISNPESVTNEIFQWLGVDEMDGQREFPTRNATPEEIVRFGGGQMLGRFVHRSRLWNSVSPLVPRSMKDLARKFSWERVTPSDESLEDVREFLRPWAHDVMERTSRLLGREFPEWSTTRG